MEVKDLKWYSAFLFLLGAILSFADPITDILTLVEFYRTTRHGLVWDSLLLFYHACRLQCGPVHFEEIWTKTVTCVL